VILIKVRPLYKNDLTFFLISKKVVCKQEYILYDVGDIFTAIGGSLGLFIGFSFLDVIIIIAKFVYEKLQPLD